MSGVVDSIKGLVGGTTSAERAARRAAQAQEMQIAGEKARVKAIEDGQRAARGGGGRFVDFVDDKLKGTFGG